MFFFWAENPIEPYRNETVAQNRVAVIEKPKRDHQSKISNALNDDNNASKAKNTKITKKKTKPINPCHFSKSVSKTPTKARLNFLLIFVLSKLFKIKFFDFHMTVDCD